MPLSAGADQNQTTSRILNKLQYAMTDVAADITTATTSDIIPMLDASDGYEIKYADSANVFQLMGVTATATEINAGTDGSANTVAVAAGGAAVTALTGGGTYLVPAVTANVTMTLPAATLGEKHKFVYVGAVADAEDWVITSPTLCWHRNHVHWQRDELGCHGLCFFGGCSCIHLIGNKAIGLA
jgi:hypothetical protein